MDYGVRSDQLAGDMRRRRYNILPYGYRWLSLYHWFGLSEKKTVKRCWEINMICYCVYGTLNFKVFIRQRVVWIKYNEIQLDVSLITTCEYTQYQNNFETCRERCPSGTHFEKIDVSSEAMTWSRRFHIYEGNYTPIVTLLSFDNSTVFTEHGYCYAITTSRLTNKE